MPDEAPKTSLAPSGNSKTISAILAAIASSYIMTQLSLAGVNFETAGVSSELIKSTIIGALVGFFAWVTPTNIVSAVRDVILFVRNAFKTWRQAAEEGKE